jgi:hypothetical protein
MKMNTIKKKIFDKTNTASNKTPHSPSAHTNEILCLALTDDFKFLVRLFFKNTYQLNQIRIVYETFLKLNIFKT